MICLKSYREVFPPSLINEVKAVCGEDVGVVLQQLLAICSSADEERKRSSLEQWFEGKVRSLGIPCTQALIKVYEWLKKRGKC